MATCPKCGQYLTDPHECRVSWRRRWLTILVMVIGAVAGFLASILLFPNSQMRILSSPTSSVLGAVIAVALWWSRPRRVD